MSTVIKRRADTLGSTSQILAVEKGKEKSSIRQKLH